jgi:hypothetical protein
MNKKIIIGLIVAVLIGIGIWVGYTFREEEPLKIMPSKKSEVRTEQAAYGWSAKKDEKEAVAQAVSMMKEKLEKSPDFVFLFSSVGYDEEKLLSEIKTLLPEAKIYGGTACLGPMTPDGFHGVEKQSVAIMGVASPEITWGVGGADMDKVSPREAGKKAILTAIESAGRQETEKPDIVFITAAPGAEEKIIAGIEEVVGKDVPIFGGSSGDNTIAGEWRQFAGGKVYKNGVALAVAYTDLKIGYAYEAGYLVTENKGTVTRAEGRIIYEIDQKPAAEVYNEWTGGVFSEKLEKGGKVWGILSEATFYPIAKVLKTPKGEPFYLAVHPLSIRPDHSLEVFAEMREGDEIALLHGGWEILLNRFRTTPQKALTRFKIEKGEAVFAVYTFCAGTMLSIPESERPKMPLLLKEVIGEVPFIGNFTFGEQGFIPGVGNQHGNLVNSIVIFGPK